MVNEAQKKWMLEASLSAIDRNFHEREPRTGERIRRTFSPPTLDEVVNNYAADSELRHKIQQMLDGDAIKQLYAAILLWKINQTKAADVLKKLADDNTELSIQGRVGFSIVETTVGIPARDFLSEQQIYGDNFSREENLNNWALAVSMEKRKLKQDFDGNSLPKWKEVLDAREGNAEKSKKLLDEIDRLKNGEIVAEKFYAAVLLTTIDEAESRKVLESLLAEKTEVGILCGDEMLNRPAREIADEMLHPEKFQQTGNEPANLIARATKWVLKTFSENKSGE